MSRSGAQASACQFARRRVAAAIALVSSSSKPPGPISTSSAAAVVPPGEVTFCRNVAAPSRRSMQQFAGAGDGFVREPGRKRRRQSGGDAGVGHRFGQQEYVGRAGAGQCGYRVHQRFVARPIRPCRWRRADSVASLRWRARHLGVRRSRRVMPRPMAAGVFGIARTIAVPAGNAARRKSMVRPAMIDSTSVDLPTYGRERGHCLRRTLRLDCDDDRAVAVEGFAFAGLSLMPRRVSAFIAFAGMRLEHGDLARLEPRASQPSSMAEPILPAPSRTRRPENLRSELCSPASVSWSASSGRFMATTISPIAAVMPRPKFRTWRRRAPRARLCRPKPRIGRR